MAKRLVREKNKGSTQDRISLELERYGFDHLHYMAPMENVPSILALGIKSHRLAQKLPHSSFALWSVQNLRERVIPGTGKRIHDYVPLYFATHTPMQYVLTEGTSKRAPVINKTDLVFIEVAATEIFQIPGVIFTDGNAAADETRFFTKLADLCEVDWEVINTPNCYSREYRRKKAAEVLVLDSIPVQLFEQIVVFNRDAEEDLKDRVRCFAVELKESSPNSNWTHLIKYRLCVDPTHY